MSEPSEGRGAPAERRNSTGTRLCICRKVIREANKRGWNVGHECRCPLHWRAAR